MKKLLVALVGVLVLGLAALLFAPPLLDDSLIKSRIIAAVKEATGRDMQIGELRLTVLPVVEVSLRNLRLANAEDMPPPDMLKLGRLDVALELWPLIGREIIVERLVISDLVGEDAFYGSGEQLMNAFRQTS